MVNLMVQELLIQILNNFMINNSTKSKLLFFEEIRVVGSWCF
jgi:hypothetical protein